MYFVVNLCTQELIAQAEDYNTASLLLMFSVDSSDGFYTDDDFAIFDEEEFEDYALMN